MGLVERGRRILAGCAARARSGRWRRALALLLLVLPLVVAGTAGAQGAQDAQVSNQWPLGDRIFDAVLLRPLGFLGTVSGFAIFVCSSPVSLPALEVDEAWDSLVQAPADFTFSRALGDF